ncbi:phosphotransferase system HPr (HPr) family protein [Sodalis ligni]|jgi:phosphotransferase system HPr (HPr) family protein|uniref:Phosphotransferase system HPr (HPr) family protein n=2 Tax=Bruguierivoracaceae TaxID=2812006 RepID=A0A4R1NL05_9GAMM|nr:phosphotransferase system HPr (HPr) family protein [Sodalis ligni]
MSMNCLIEDFIINNPNGLHARPGAFFVDTLKPFKSEVKICNTHRGEKQVNARSLLSLMVLGIKQGHNVRVFVQGDDAPQALEALRNAIASGLGE